MSQGEVQTAPEGGAVVLGFQGEAQHKRGGEELLELSMPEDTLGPFQNRKRALVSLQVPLKLQAKIAGPPVARVPGTWSSAFWVRSGRERPQAWRQGALVDTSVICSVSAGKALSHPLADLVKSASCPVVSDS